MIRIASIGIALALAVVFAAPALSPASADESDDLITWSVKPADQNGKDGRAWVELDVDPGDTIEEHLAITNFGDTAVTFGISAADGYLTKTGRFTMLPATQQSQGAGTWIDVPETITIDPDSTAVVPYTISVPENATPGDTAAGVAASVFSSGTDASGTQVGLESRVGFRVMLRVSGELAPVYDVTGVEGAFDLAWNPFRPGKLTVGYDVVNDGNTRLLVTAVPKSSGRFDGPVDPTDADLELLPGDVRHVERTITDVWPIGLVRVVIDADARVTPGDAAAGAEQREIWVWAVPVPQLLLLLGAGLLVTAMIWRRRRKRVVVAQLIEDARREAELAVREELGAPERLR